MTRPQLIIIHFVSSRDEVDMDVIKTETAELKMTLDLLP